MSAHQDRILEYSPGLSGYSPANFGDAEENQPSEIVLDPTRTGTQTPYSNVFQNTMQRSLVDFRETRDAQGQLNLPTNWKKRMREFLLERNEDILGFLNNRPSDQYNSVPNNSIPRIEAFMRKYGRPDFQVGAAGTALRDRLFDLSGSDYGVYMAQVEEDLQKHGKSSYNEVMIQVRFLIDQYRETGEAILRTNGALRLKLDTLDKVTSKVLTLGELPQTASFPSYLETIRQYIQEVSDENKIEKDYVSLLNLYKKFVILRESIQFLRFFEASQHEPLCSICFQEQIQFALVPCGHTYCGTCAKRQMMNCCICRGNVREKVKLFLG